MEAMWNHMHLERPPNATCQIPCRKFGAAEFFITLDKVISDLTSQALLHKEAAILSRLIYRMKCKFRNDKGLKSMFKVNKALLKYLMLSLEKEYANLKSYVSIGEKYVTLPSKQMVEYVLVKTQGFAKLMLRVEKVCKESAYFLKCRINLGHAWSIAIIAYSVVSRIWLLSRYLVKQSCIWYNSLYDYLTLFENSGLSWLPENYELPSDLKSWLSVPWIDQPTPRVPRNRAVKNTMFKLITPCDDDSDEDLVSDVQDFSKEIESKISPSYVEKKSAHNPAPNINNNNIIPNDDTGEFIDRRSFDLKRARDTQTSTKAEEQKEFAKVEETNGKEYDPGTSIRNKDSEFHIESISRGKVKNITEKSKNSTRKKDAPKLLTFDDVKTRTDLLALLHGESYPGLDKLQWNIIRKKGRKLLNKLDASSKETKQSVVIRKVTKRIKSWIT
ncbi:Nucleolus and neural progenitor protein [Anthophora plagiata]